MDKYLYSGEKVRVLESLSGGRYLVASYFVRYGWDGNEEEDFDIDHPFIVGKGQVYDEPPTAVISEQIAGLTKGRDELEQEIREMTQELTNLRMAVQTHQKRYAHIPQLAQLDQFLDGKLTHYVLHTEDGAWHLPQIVTFDQMADSYDKKMPKLLTLFGNTKGQLDWRLNSYSDGSGSYTTCVPCTSYDEALSVLTEHVHAKMETEKSQRLIDLCREYEIPISDEYLQIVHQEKIREALKNLRDKRAAFEKAKMDLAEIETSV